uniref:ATP phosphoribosyltransferase n=1 Tax=Quercus lobata TaxID=97700 RepID=A0A7N2L2F7_QUELO
MEKYKQVEYLGYESIGEVWLVENKKTTELFAMKCFKRGHQIDKYLAREIIIQKSLYHPNVIQFKEARYYFQQLISGVFYCHTKGMCHRDLKPENILLDGSDLPCLKICDIGFSKQYRMHSKLKSAIGTPQYSAPEVCSREYDGKLADLWSCGVILYTMLVGGTPKETNACPFSLPDSLSPDSKDLLARMLVVDPRKRIAIEEIMKHRWFKKKLKGKLAEAFQVTKENPRFALQSDEEIVIIVEEAIIPPPEDANVTEEYFEFEEEEEDEDSSCGSCLISTPKFEQNAWKFARQPSINTSLDVLKHTLSDIVLYSVVGTRSLSILKKHSIQLANLEVWFQRPKEIVRKLVSGDLDLGIVGFDTVSEYGQGNEDLILVHDALEYGDCHLSLAIPKYGIFENINSLKELAQMPQWTPEKPLRVATGFTYLGPKFMKENGLKCVTFSTADGALEAAPAMGIADAILDLVSSGTTLKENNLKEIKGGIVLESQAVLVASRKALIQRKGALDITHEILERLEAHLRAVGQFTVTANMRGSSAEEVAERVLSQPSLSGLQGPTVSPVFRKRDGKVASDYFAIVICVPKKALYKSVKQLRAVCPVYVAPVTEFCDLTFGGSGVLVSPLTYIFDEETPRWHELLRKLGL